MYNKQHSVEDRDKCIEMLGGNLDAYNYICKIRFIAHTWDELVDRDRPISSQTINTCFWGLLFELHSDPFYLANITFLRPVLMCIASDWIATQELEYNPKGENDMIVSFVLRAGTSMTMSCLLLTGGLQAVYKYGAELLRLSHREKFSDYVDSIKERRE